ncbi:MAG TPA: phage holin family protein [Actinomycetota bacterium]|nr:phage holin family protein [Actinomycetota bacterium]
MSDSMHGNGGVGPGSTGSPAAAGPPPALPSRRPLGAVIASAVDGARTLVRKHLELARIEMTEVVAERAKGVGMMAAAAVFGLFAVGFVAASGSAALDLVLPAWAAHLIVAAVFLAVAAGLVLAGRRATKSAPTGPEQTQRTLKEDARWAKQQLAR